jgi:hypothetical protein
MFKVRLAPPLLLHVGIRQRRRVEKEEMLVGDRSGMECGGVGSRSDLAKALPCMLCRHRRSAEQIWRGCEAPAQKVRIEILS